MRTIVRGVAAGAVRETVIQSGLPPMAAMSERLTAAALWARSFVGTSGKKWVPATRVSVLISSCEPMGGVRTAASSPTPRVTLGSAGEGEVAFDDVAFAGHWEGEGAWAACRSRFWRRVLPMRV